VHDWPYLAHFSLLSVRFRPHLIRLRLRPDRAADTAGIATARSGPRAAACDFVALEHCRQRADRIGAAAGTSQGVGWLLRGGSHDLPALMACAGAWTANSSRSACH